MGLSHSDPVLDTAPLLLVAFIEGVRAEDGEGGAVLPLFLLYKDGEGEMAVEALGHRLPFSTPLLHREGVGVRYRTPKAREEEFLGER